MARRNKPHDPAAAARALTEKTERDAELSRLRDMGAAVTLDPGGRVVSARLSNVFNLLLARHTITPNQYDAAYRLAEDWAAWKGLDGKRDVIGEIIDGGAGCPEIVTDRMIQGGSRVAAVMFDLTTQTQRILKAFMVATVEEDRPMAWRGIMHRLGVTARDRQTEAVVEALDALRGVYEGTRRVAA